MDDRRRLSPRRAARARGIARAWSPPHEWRPGHAVRSESKLRVGEIELAAAVSDSGSMLSETGTSTVLT